jgi:hypothetical protein
VRYTSGAAMHLTQALALSCTSASLLLLLLLFRVGELDFWYSHASACVLLFLMVVTK